MKSLTNFNIEKYLRIYTFYFLKLNFRLKLSLKTKDII